MRYILYDQISCHLYDFNSVEIIANLFLYIINKILQINLKYSNCKPYYTLDRMFP